MPDRVLIVGLGSIGARHARLIRAQVPAARMIALRRTAVGNEAAPGIDDFVTCLDDAIRLRPEAAIIANPATLHLETAMRLAKSGVHLLVEKPIAAASAGVADLIAQARDGGTVLMTGYNLRFSPSLQQFREFLRRRVAGRVLSVRAEIGQYLPTWRPQSDYRKTVSARAELGGGVLLELSHEIDYLRWLFGEVQWVSAIARRQSSLDIDVEDTAHLVLGFASTDGAAPLVAEVNMDFARHDTVRSCTAIGESGTLRWNALTGTVEIFAQGAQSWRTVFKHPPDRDESYVSQWRHFVACIEGRETPLVSGTDGLAALRIVEAARRSSDSGATVTVRHDEGATGQAA